MFSLGFLSVVLPCDFGPPAFSLAGGVPEKCSVQQKGPHLYNCVYKPMRPGPYVVNAHFGGDHIHRSPFDVLVGPERHSNIRAYGPGLEGGMVGYPAVFTVETNGETGSLGESSSSSSPGCWAAVVNNSRCFLLTVRREVFCVRV